MIKGLLSKLGFASFQKPVSSDDWWHSEFTQTERDKIEEAFRPLGSITTEHLIVSDNVGNLGALVGHLKKEHLRHFGYRTLKRADEIVADEDQILTLHYYYMSRGDFYYRWRDHDSFALAEAVESYKSQIGLAPIASEEFLKDKALGGNLPSHRGFHQLRVIEEKRHNLTLARSLCMEAMRQGWAGNWENDIERLEKKIAKQTSN